MMEALQMEDDPLAMVKSNVQRIRQEMIDRHDRKADAADVILFRTGSIDRLLRTFFDHVVQLYQKEAGRPPMAALMGQGGYGRTELCLHSDIDLLLLYEGRGTDFVKFLNQKMIQVLWDSGLEIGFVARTVDDCRRQMEKDLTILSALIDARYLAGDKELMQKFQKMFRRYFSSKKNQAHFMEQKREENRERAVKYGGSVYLLEPNLKEGEGGLRDFHSLYWFARILKNGEEGGGPRDLVAWGFLSQEEFDRLWEALNFLWTIRNQLHRLSGRRVDQLLFEFQESLARWMGHENNTEFLGVELFMQRYYSQAALIHRMTEKVLRRMTQKELGLFPPPKASLGDPHCRLVSGRLTLTSPDLFEKEPLYLLKVFNIARKFGVELDDVTRERVERNIFRIDESFRNSQESGKLFREMLGEPIGLGKMLGVMNDVGILGAFLPEFDKLRFRAQHDTYHVYTVDVHSIFAVVELGRLFAGDYHESFPTLSEMVKDIERKDLLAFATFYHDIGKGEGKGHVEKGAPVIRRSGERLGFSPDDVNMLEFLERSHLIMTHLAFRRDLEEQNLIIQFAKAMQTSGGAKTEAKEPDSRGMERLNMLYIQTFCDVRAVSAEAMSSWKASLLEYLYLKTREVLQKGVFTKESVSSTVQRILSGVLQPLPDEEDRAKCREFFSIMSPRYLLATPPANIIRHVRLWEKFLENPIVFETRVLEREGWNEITLLTWESPSLFSLVCGVFAAHNINILEAQLNLSNRGHALHTFKVTDPEGHSIADLEKWVRVENDLRELLQGRIKIENLVDEKFLPSLFKKKLARVLPSKVEIDNDISAYYTIIDLYTHDRVGLLYQITTTLWALGLYVDVSKISTKVDQVADTFYVRDIFGHKITSEERLKKVKEVLLKVLETEPAPGWRPPTIA